MTKETKINTLIFYLDKKEHLQPQKDLSKIFLIAADVEKQNTYSKATSDRHNFFQNNNQGNREHSGLAIITMDRKAN